MGLSLRFGWNEEWRKGGNGLSGPFGGARTLGDRGLDTAFAYCTLYFESGDARYEAQLRRDAGQLVVRDSEGVQAGEAAQASVQLHQLVVLNTQLHLQPPSDVRCKTCTFIYLSGL